MAWYHKKQKKTKKSTRGLAAASAFLGLLLAGCGFSPKENEIMPIYGPPEDYSPLPVVTTGETERTISDNEVEAEEPADSNSAKPDDEQRDSRTDTGNDADMDLEFHPEENEEICIYGPPEMFE